MRRKTLGWTAGALVGGFFLTGLIVGPAEESPPPHKPKVRTVVKTKVIKEPYLSDACRIALDQAGKMAQAAQKIGDVGNAELDLLSDGRIAMSSNEIQELVRLSDRQHVIDESITAAMSALVASSQDYDTAVKGCEQSQLDR